MAHSHYVMDLYYPQGSDPDRFRREVLRIDVKDDEAAEAEGRRIDAWRKPAYFVLRSIQTSARNREEKSCELTQRAAGRDRGSIRACS